MTRSEPVDHDERTTAVENAGYRWAFGFLTFALLIDVAARSFLRNEAPWDLLFLVIAGGSVVGLRQARERALPGHWGRRVAIAMACAAVISGVCAVAAYTVGR
jgi:hypothetical protein